MYQFAQESIDPMNITQTNKGTDNHHFDEKPREAICEGLTVCSVNWLTNVFFLCSENNETRREKSLSRCHIVLSKLELIFMSKIESLF